MYDGTVFFHLYPELTDPKPIFNTFLEGALHCAEVARSHPAYCSAHFHEAYDQAAAIDGAPHGYFNMSIFSCPPAELWSAFEDLHECLDIGHANQVHHPLPCREIAADPGPESAVSSAPHGGVRFAEPDAVILVAIPSEKETAEETPDADWLEWSGANRARSVGTYLGATLHEAVETREGGAPAFRRIARVELGAAPEEAVTDALRAAREGAGEGAVVGAFRCAFNIEKTGTPAGAMPAVREMNRRARENEEEKNRREGSGDETKSGTV